MIDDGSDAGSGRAQQRTRGLERAHGGDLIVLLRRERMTIPGVVGDIHHQGRVSSAAGELAAERVLVADVDRQPLAGDDKWFLVCRARSLIGERNGKNIANEPAEYGLERNRLAEGDQMVLAIDLRGRGASGHDATGGTIGALAAPARLEADGP